MIGAPIFRYDPYVASPDLPSDLHLIHIAGDPSRSKIWSRPAQHPQNPW
ncbi:hypothetical protein [Xanthobacter agilis]|uniref:Uncharacterized protein n=1 Tax=Xanthobacter agilis TaxID=47492 RepID=A0ABU0LGA4_XANAG|nr:hypothetical protein [Xanthobacter agilis]MDQ0506128.1 hypothetical protein [Xanthobacter agilis]